MPTGIPRPCVLQSKVTPSSTHTTCKGCLLSTRKAAFDPSKTSNQWKGHQERRFQALPATCPASPSVLTQAEGDTSVTTVPVAAGVAGLATISQVQKYKVHLLPHFHNSPRPLSGLGLSSLIQEHFTSGIAFAMEEHFF